MYNGWFKREGFNPKTDSDCDAPLLGERQEKFLYEWSTDWQEGDWMKFVFSQSPFDCLQTLPDGTFGGHQAWFNNLSCRRISAKRHAQLLTQTVMVGLKLLGTEHFE